MNKQVIIGISVAAIIVVIIIIFLVMKKEKFSYNSSGMVPSSGTGTDVSPAAYMISDQNGNLSVTNDGIMNNLNVSGKIALGGYIGKVGDVLVSNGEKAPPVWTGIGNIQKLIAFKQYKLADTTEGNTIVTVPINFPITPNMIIIVDMTMSTYHPNLDRVYAIGISATIADQTQIWGSGTDSALHNSGNGRLGWATNMKFVFTGLSGSSNILTIKDIMGVYYPLIPAVTDNVFVYAVEAP